MVSCHFMRDRYVLIYIFRILSDTFALSILFFFFKQKTAYEMRISDWSSDVCSSDLAGADRVDADALRPEFLCHRAGIGHQRALRGRIDRGARTSAVTAEVRADRKSTRLNSSH